MKERLMLVNAKQLDVNNNTNNKYAETTGNTP